MQSGLNAFAPDIRDFGVAFIYLQRSRRLADYDPDAEFRRTDAVNLIDRAEAVIIGFEGVDATGRKGFAARELFRVGTP